MTTWRNAYKSFYYEAFDTSTLQDIVLPRAETALLVIDVQNTYLQDDPGLPRGPVEQSEFERWTPFYRRMRGIVIPTIQRLLMWFRADGRRVLFARIACLTPDGADRSLSQRRPGFNNLMLPAQDPASQIIPELAPLPGELVFCKTTDSAVTGTNMRLLLSNMGIRHVVVAGIFTDQCVSSTVRSLADESFNVILVEDGCAAGTDELHRRELEIINNIYCQVLTADEAIEACRKGTPCSLS